MTNLSRRGLLGMFAAGVGAAIVTPGIIMPIKPVILPKRPTFLDLMELRIRDAERAMMDSISNDIYGAGVTNFPGLKLIVEDIPWAGQVIGIDHQPQRFWRNALTSK